MGWENTREWRVGKDFEAEDDAYWTVQYRLRPSKTTHTPTQYNRGLIQFKRQGKGKAESSLYTP